MARANIKFLKFSSKEVASYFVANSIYRIFAWLDQGEIMLLGTATGQTPVLTYKELLKLEKESSWFSTHAEHFI